jgi:hypothetical protein
MKNVSVKVLLHDWNECEFLGMLAKLQKATVCYIMSYLSLGMKAPNGQIFVTFDIRVFLKNQLRISKFDKNLTRITGTLHEDQCTLLIISCWIIVRMREIYEANGLEKIATHISCSAFPPKFFQFMR